MRRLTMRRLSVVFVNFLRISAALLLSPTGSFATPVATCYCGKYILDLIGPQAATLADRSGNLVAKWDSEDATPFDGKFLTYNGRVYKCAYRGALAPGTAVSP
jgi:hypothetical protein